MDDAIKDALRRIRLLFPPNYTKEDLIMDAIENVVKSDFNHKKRKKPVYIGDAYNSICEYSRSPIYLIDSSSDPNISGIKDLEFPSIDTFQLRNYIPYRGGLTNSVYRSIIKKYLDRWYDGDINELVDELTSIKLNDGFYEWTKNADEYLPKIGLFYSNMDDISRRHTLMLRSSSSSGAKGYAYKAYCLVCIMAYIQRSASPTKPISDIETIPEFNIQSSKDNMNQMIIADTMLTNSEDNKVETIKTTKFYDKIDMITPTGVTSVKI